MTSEQYRDYLDAFSDEGYSSASLHPVQATQIFAVESQLGVNLPEQYETFLTTVGTGEECGGVGRWYHLDIMSTGNIIEMSGQIPGDGDAAGMLVIYDSCDGDLYGFLPDKARFRPEVFAWDGDVGEMRPVAESFEAFLDCLANDGLDDF
jgi:hypothetical protein